MSEQSNNLYEEKRIRLKLRVLEKLEAMGLNVDWEQSMCGPVRKSRVRKSFHNI